MICPGLMGNILAVAGIFVVAVEIAISLPLLYWENKHM